MAEEKDQCLFCDLCATGTETIVDTRCFFVKFDSYPVNRGHALVIPKRHCQDIFSLVANEWEDLFIAIGRTKKYLDRIFEPNGYNIGINCGEAAGQTVSHLHIHIIPRYKGDVENPRGGIRNFKCPPRDY